MSSRLLVTVLLVCLLAVPVGTAVTTSQSTAPNGAVRAFVADDLDPEQGAIPPFVFSGLADAIQLKNLSVHEASRIRDFTYNTTQPQYRVGDDQQTLREYRRDQLQSIEQNKSTSLWLPDSKRSNGTVVKDAHVTILGTQSGVASRFNATQSKQANASQLHYIPRNGTVFAQLDYSTVLPEQTCTVTGETKTCLRYRLLDQRVNRTLRIGNQEWRATDDPPRQLSYKGARATEPTTMQVEATIETTVAVRTRVYTRDGGGWTVANTSLSEPTVFSETVEDSSRVVVTTNQPLTVTQTVVESDTGDDRLILQFTGLQSMTDRRLWSSAQFGESNTRLQNVWGVYSQRRYQNATRGSQRLVDANGTVNGSNATLSQSATTSQQETVAFPNVLELQLLARSPSPTIQRGPNTGVLAGPEIDSQRGFTLSQKPAPLEKHVNLTSVPAQGTTTIVITNAAAPITEIRDIHGDRIPLQTHTTRERQTNLSTTMLNETHARVQLTDAETGQPLAGQPLWLSGAARTTVQTNAQGVAIIERRDLYVTTRFRGTTVTSDDVYYDATSEQIAFSPDPFAIYQLLMSLAGALVSIAAFLIFYLPIAYLRGGSSS